MNVRDEGNGDVISTPKVAYIWSKEYEKVCDDLPSNIGRVYLKPLTILTAIVLPRTFPHPRIWPRQIHEVCSLHLIH